MPAKEQRGLRDAISSRLSTPTGNRPALVRRKPANQSRPGHAHGQRLLLPARSVTPQLSAAIAVCTGTATAPVGTADFHSHITEHANQKQAGLCFHARPEGKELLTPTLVHAKGCVRKHTTQLVAEAAPVASNVHPPPPAHKRLQEGLMLTCQRHPVVLCHSTGLCVPGKRHTTAMRK